MKDRVPLYPGRVTLTPVSGQANTFDLTRADQPTQEGTPLNKASLLNDATAALYGLPNTAVPDDVLSKIKTLIDSANANANTKARIAVGSYTGTGTYGASNPNSLTFGFAPKLVYIYKTNGKYTYQMLCGVGAVRTSTVYSGDSGTASLSRYSSVMSLNGNQLTWYSYDSKTAQLNEDGGTYNYIAIG